MESSGSLPTPKAPREALNEARTPKTPKNKKTPGGIYKTSGKRKKNKIDEAQRVKMELAMRTFLKKKPPDQTNTEGGAADNM